MIRDEQALAALMRENLGAFIAKAFQIVSPNKEFMPSWHIDIIAYHLMLCYLGETTRLIITLPPRSLKSICASVAFPAWVLGKDPSRKIINVSYSADLSAKFARDTRSVMESDWYHQLFPMTQLMRSAELDLETTRKGVRYATSVGGTLTGRGGSLIIIDDPLKPQEALSETQRNSVNQWYENTLYTRLDNKKSDSIILVQQRLHVDDLVAHVLEKEEWVHLDFPAIATEDQFFQLPGDYHCGRKAGGALHPEREPLSVLDNIRSTIGSFIFESQYQQQPVPAKGNMIKWSWFLSYETPPPFAHGDRIIQSWDTASKATEISDYSVCTTWHIKGNDYYLLDVFRERLEFPELQQAVIRNARQWKATTVLIEDTAHGTALVQNLRKKAVAGMGNPIAIKPEGDKIVRMSAQSAKIQAGHVHLPRTAPWLGEFQKELLAFPKGKHDDQVDSLSQFLNWYENRPKIRMVKLRGL